ncbi:unnamed protein product, partial [marine sediment metagenome]
MTVVGRFDDCIAIPVSHKLFPRCNKRASALHRAVMLPETLRLRASVADPGR